MSVNGKRGEEYEVQIQYEASTNAFFNMYVHVVSTLNNQGHTFSSLFYFILFYFVFF